MTRTALNIADCPIWIMEVSRDEGKTWIMEQSFGMYKTQHRAATRASVETSRHIAMSRQCHCAGWLYRAREYRPVEVKA
jgi:hypothetical protein